MKYSDQVARIVTGLVEESERLSYQEAAIQDQKDAEEVESDPSQYQASLRVIVTQLRKFSGKKFEAIYFERNYQGAISKQGESGLELFIDFSSLKKSDNHLALIVAHEWGHLAMGHKRGDLIGNYEKECQADYYAGIFLGAHDYQRDDILKTILKMPQRSELTHGTPFARACIVLEGHLHGTQMRAGKSVATHWPGMEFPNHKNIQAIDGSAPPKSSRSEFK